MLLVAALLASCARAEGPPQEQTSAPTTAAAAATLLPTARPRSTVEPRATLEPQPTATPDALVLWATEQGQGLELLRRLAEEWSQGGGRRIAVVGKSGDGLRADLIAAGLAGEPAPDMFWGSEDDLYLLLSSGQLQPVGPANSAAAFIPATVSGALEGGQLWGLPVTARGSLLLLYNRALLSQPPTTTDELIVQSRAANRGDQVGLVAAWAEARWLVALLTGFGGAALSPDGTQPTLDTPEMISALSLLRELRVAGPSTPSSYEDGSALFGAGLAAMALDGDWSLPIYRALSGTLDLGVAPLPLVPATGRVAAPPLGGSYLMLSKNLADLELAETQRFGAFLALPKQQVVIASTLQRLPALRAALAAPAISSDPALSAAAAQLEGASGIPPTKALRCAWQAINTQLPPLLTNERSQEATAAAMQQDAEGCMR